MIPFPGFALFLVIHTDWHHGISDRVTYSVMHGFLDAHVRDSKSPEPSLSPQIIRVFLDNVDRVIGHTIVLLILVLSLVLSNEK